MELAAREERGGTLCNPAIRVEMDLIKFWPLTPAERKVRIRRMIDQRSGWKPSGATMISTSGAVAGVGPPGFAGGTSSPSSGT